LQTHRSDPADDLARRFSRLANLPNYALDPLSRFEAALWRQVRQIIFALMLRVGSRQDLPVYEREKC
jgi:hypothetical protein